MTTITLTPLQVELLSGWLGQLLGEDFIPDEDIPLMEDIITQVQKGL